MSDISFDSHKIRAAGIDHTIPSATLVETYWGYVVHSTQAAHAGTLLVRAVSFVAGAGFAAAALALWLVPSALIQNDTMVMRLGMTVLFAVLCYLLICVARRTGKIEWHVDLGLGELRHVAIGMGGKGVLRGQIGFDAVEDLQIVDAGSDRGEMSLQICMFGGREHTEIARGTRADLNAILARFRIDFGDKNAPREFAAVCPDQPVL